MENMLYIPRTALQAFEILPEATACEAIDNTPYMTPSPTTTHQILLLKLASKIQFFVEEKNSGKTIIAPCDIYLDNEQSVIQPDIFFIKKDREHIIKEQGVYGAPDLIIELLSTSKVHDLERKLELYQRNGVSEYIIIDTESKQVWQYVLQANQTYLQKPAGENGKVFIHQVNLGLAF